VLGPLAAAALTLAACGGDDGSDAVATTTAEAAVAEASTSGAAGSTASAPVPADGKVAAGDSMMAMLPVDYVYEGEMPALDGPSGAWRWSQRQTPTAEQIAAVASALGVEGQVTEQPADMGGGWVVGDEGATRLTVGVDAQGSWSLIALTDPVCVGDAVTSVGVATEPAAGKPPLAPDATPAEPAPAADGAVPETVAPPDPIACVAPAGIPSAEEARAKAVDLMLALGLNPDGYELTADSQEWGAWVDARLLVDGLAAPVLTSFGFGPEGVLTYASGQLFGPEPAGPYERVGTAAALERLQADQFRSYSPAVDPAVSEPAPRPAAEPAGAEAPVSSPAGEAPPVDAGTPTDVVDTTAPEPVTVVLNGAEPGWWTIWADDGTVWLMPGYDFLTNQGERISVPAVAQIDMPVVETMTGMAEAPAEADLAAPLGG
jgi:hypothetical protein